MGKILSLRAVGMGQQLFCCHAARFAQASFQQNVNNNKMVKPYTRFQSQGHVQNGVPLWQCSLIPFACLFVDII